MTDFAFYWKHFARERKRGDWPVQAWYSPSDAVVKQMEPGDRIWLFTSGDACGMPETKAGFLVQVFALKKAIKNTGEDKEYPTNAFHFLLVAVPEKVVKIDPPLNVDSLVRPENHDVNEPFGLVLKQPRLLRDDVVKGLLELLERERPEEYKSLTSAATPAAPAEKD